MDVLLRVETGGDVSASVVGTMTRAIVPSQADVAGFAGIRFRPGEALAFLDVAAEDARDAFLTPLDAGLDDIDGLVEHVGSTTPLAWPSALERWLLARLSRARAADRRLRRAIDALTRAGGSAPISDLAANLGISGRQLERAFGERVGLSPKSFARVLRLQKLVGLIDGACADGNGVPWAALAAECGFSDQAHLVRDVRALAGVTPTALARERMSDLFNTRSGAPTMYGAT
jgi:AraC-like DNA-binding protein